MIVSKRGMLGVSCLVLLAVPVLGHHSFAAYDMRKLNAASGTIKEFRWGAPHSSMVLTYKAKGKDALMSVVSGSPLMFSKQGFKPKDFKAGLKVSITYHPNVNGSPGGAMATMKLPDGRTFSDSEAARAAPK